MIDITNGKLHDGNVLNILILEARLIYVMDRGYVDFGQLYISHQARAFFVPQAKAIFDIEGDMHGRRPKIS